MRTISKPNNIKIHFILGSGRSGTSLLSHILNNHKNCISASESKHLLLFYEKYHNITQVTVELIEDANQYFDLKIKAKTMPETEDMPPPFTLGEKIDYFEFCKRLYFISANYKNTKPELTTIIDKNPFYTLQTDKLSQLLPDAKFLCLIRDHRGFVLSNIQSKEPHTTHLPIQYHSLVWRFYNKLVLELKSKYPNKVDFLHYENLVTDKEKALREICDFFTIENDANCFNYQNKIDFKKENVLEDKRIVHKMNTLLKPINADRLEAWKGCFTNFQLKIIDYWCGKTGEKFGYAQTTKINVIESMVILIISLPYYSRVWVYFKLKSIKLDVYLSEGRKVNYFNSLHNN